MDISQEVSLLCQNTVEVLSRGELEARLKSARQEKRPLRIKAGFDPSAPDIHLGHTVLLRKLRQFQDLGHKVVFIIGDYTAMIGDPSGQNKTRPALSKVEVDKNAKTYQTQASKILDNDLKKIETVKNSSWLDKLSLRDFLERVATQTTVARVLERDDFEKRMAESQPITYREFTYPLLQGYDSVEVQADVELGGTDQKFNLLMGRNLQKSFGQEPQIVMTLPLLVGLDGVQKMSKSLGNHIGITDLPKDVFGKSMSVPDNLMPMYFNLLTSENGDQIQADIDSGKLHPRDAKIKLARLLTEFLHGKEAAGKEAVEFDRVFSQKQDPSNPETKYVKFYEIDAAALLREVNAVSSSSEAYRLLRQGAVTLDGQKISDPKAKHKLKDGGSLLKVGKKIFLKLIPKP